MHRAVVLLPILLLAAACGDRAVQPSQTTGTTPDLPPPRHRLVPTIAVAPAVGWAADETPRAADGLAVGAFARDLDHPRWLYVLPNGDVLVAETNAPPKPADKGGIKGWFKGRAMKKAGAGTPSANRITLLRDADGDGRAELRTVFASGIHSPFGMALVGERLFVANTDGIVELHYTAGAQQADGPAKPLVDLPANPPNGH
ncbi:MAG TPA: sorbosone dehydrogenase family protein, partial [Tahibacter sp.]|nr:sorbosone dehydrogenase family protein [Tahibacter sp.]